MSEEEGAIRTRFLTLTSVSKGEPPLKRLTRRFLQLVSDVESGAAEKAEQTYEALCRDLVAIEYQARKREAIISANNRERESYVDKQRELEAAIEQAKRDIEAKKIELQEARIERQHNEEYEVLRLLIDKETPRATTLSEIGKVEEEIAAIKLESDRLKRLMERRRKQFALLLHCVDELQGLDDLDDADIKEIDMGDGEHPVTMQIDDSA